MSIQIYHFTFIPLDNNSITDTVKLGDERLRMSKNFANIALKIYMKGPLWFLK